MDVLIEERIILDGKEYRTGHTKEYIRVVTESEENLENQSVNCEIGTSLVQDFMFAQIIR